MRVGRWPRRLAAVLLAGVLTAACAGAQQVSDAAEVFAQALNVASGQLDGEMLGLAAGETRPLAVGDAVRVDGSGEAHLRFSDHLLVHLFRDSTVRVDAMADPDAPPWAELRLEAGTVLADLDPGEVADRRLEITTDAAVVRAVGTRFLTAELPLTGVTWVIVGDGVVEVTGARTTVRVEAGFATFVVPGEAPVPPFPATREGIGDALPGLDVLTNGALDDEDLLLDDTAVTEETEDPETPDPDTEDPETEDPETEDPQTEDPDPTEPPTPTVHRLTVSTTGDGEGVVRAPGISCGEDCTETFDAPTTVDVVAEPADSSAIGGWTPACAPQLRRASRVPTCAVEVSGDTTLELVFLRRWTVDLSVKGEGSVAVDGQRCISVCSLPALSGQTLTLSATAADGWRFAGYTAPCGDAATCELTIGGDVQLTAVFDRDIQFDPQQLPSDLLPRAPQALDPTQPPNDLR